MNSNEASTEARELIISFVRGEHSWEILEKAGVYIGFKDNGFEISNPWQVGAKANLMDVAKGLLAYRDSPGQLKRWAGIILAASSFIDLSEDFDTTAEGDILLNALWDATFEDEINQNAFTVAEKVIRVTSRQG